MNEAELLRENQRLKNMIAHMKGGGCHVAHPGETTFECSVHHEKYCWACRARYVVSTLVRIMETWDRNHPDLGLLHPKEEVCDCPVCDAREFADTLVYEAPENRPETDDTSLRRAMRLVVDAAETLSSAAGYEPDGEGGMNHRGMCQQEMDAVERVKSWLGPRPITRELRDAIITMGGKIPPGTRILESRSGERGEEYGGGRDEMSSPLPGYETPDRVYWCKTCNGGVASWGVDRNRPQPRCPACHETNFDKTKFVPVKATAEAKAEVLVEVLQMFEPSGQRTRPRGRAEIHDMVKEKLALILRALYTEEG